MERMEIEKREYDRLKSREEKLMAYYAWYEEEGVTLPHIEDVITRSIELKKENEELKDKIKRMEKIKKQEYPFGLVRTISENTNGSGFKIF